MFKDKRIFYSWGHIGDSSTRQGHPLSPLLFNTLLKLLANATEQKKITGDLRIGKEKSKQFLF